MEGVNENKKPTTEPPIAVGSRPATDKEMLFIAYGALKVSSPKGDLVVQQLENHLFPVLPENDNR